MHAFGFRLRTPVKAKGLIPHLEEGLSQAKGAVIGETDESNIVIAEEEKAPLTLHFTSSQHSLPGKSPSSVQRVVIGAVKHRGNYDRYVYFFYEESEQTLYLFNRYTYFSAEDPPASVTYYRMQIADFAKLFVQEKFIYVGHGSWFWTALALGLGDVTWQILCMATHGLETEYETASLLVYPFVIACGAGLFQGWRQQQFSSVLFSSLRLPASEEKREQINSVQAHSARKQCAELMAEVGLSMVGWEIGVDYLGQVVLGLDPLNPANIQALFELAGLGGGLAAAGFILANCLVEWLREGELQQGWTARLKLMQAAAITGFLWFIFSVMNTQGSLMYIDSLGDYGNAIFSNVFTLGASWLFFSLVNPRECAHSFYSSAAATPLFKACTQPPTEGVVQAERVSPPSGSSTPNSEEEKELPPSLSASVEGASVDQSQHTGYDGSNNKLPSSQSYGGLP